jgi:hypothetical protein
MYDVRNRRRCPSAATAFGSMTPRKRFCEQLTCGPARSYAPASANFESWSFAALRTTNSLHPRRVPCTEFVTRADILPCTLRFCHDALQNSCIRLIQSVTLGIFPLYRWAFTFTLLRSCRPSSCTQSRSSSARQLVGTSARSLDLELAVQGCSFIRPRIRLMRGRRRSREQVLVPSASDRLEP